MSDIPEGADSPMKQPWADQIDLVRTMSKSPRFTVPDILPPLLKEEVAIEVTIVPGYQRTRPAISVAGTRARTAYTYLVHASGNSKTGSQGTASISTDDILGTATPGQPMFRELHPSYDAASSVGSTSTDEDKFPGTQAMLGSAPSTVVTGNSGEPHVFTVENVNLQRINSQTGMLKFAWNSPVPQPYYVLDFVRVNSFNLDGSTAKNVGFDWHMTMQVQFVIYFG